MPFKVGHHRPAIEIGPPVKMAFRWRADHGPSCSFVI